MKKTIRIIDLLNMRANREEVPNKINFYGIWIYEELNDDYYSNSKDVYLFEKYLKEEIFRYLNYEVEIIEENKPIEKLNIQSVKDNPTNMYIVNEYGTKCYMTKHSIEIALKVNELIDLLNKIVNKLEKGDDVYE